MTHPPASSAGSRAAPRGTNKAVRAAFPARNNTESELISFVSCGSHATCLVTVTTPQNAVGSHRPPQHPAPSQHSSGSNTGRLGTHPRRNPDLFPSCLENSSAARPAQKSMYYKVARQHCTHFCQAVGSHQHATPTGSHEGFCGEAGALHVLTLAASPVPEAVYVGGDLHGVRVNHVPATKATAARGQQEQQAPPTSQLLKNSHNTRLLKDLALY